MAAFTYTAPVVGGSENTWGTTLNQNWADLSTFLGSLDSSELVVLNGLTASTAELNILHDVTANGLTVQTADLGTTAGDSIQSLSLRSDTSNADQILFTAERTSTGANWETAAHRMQRKVDADLMGYMQFGNNTSDLITFGADATEYMRIDNNGNVGIGKTNPATALDVDGTVTATALDVTGTVTATSYVGDGSALTGISGSTTVGDVGTYIFGRRAGSSNDQGGFIAGGYYAGSVLYPAGLSASHGGDFSGQLDWNTSIYRVYVGDTASAALSGTWRAMGTSNAYVSVNPVTLFVRIS